MDGDEVDIEEAGGALEVLVEAMQGGGFQVPDARAHSISEGKSLLWRPEFPETGRQQSPTLSGAR
jgi:hypothetical protein